MSYWEEWAKYYEWVAKHAQDPLLAFVDLATSCNLRPHAVDDIKDRIGYRRSLVRLAELEATFCRKEIERLVPRMEDTRE